MICFPGCKFTARFPRTGKKTGSCPVGSHDAEGCGVKISGRRKSALDRITDSDTIIYICNTCAVFFNEGTPAKAEISLEERAPKRFAAEAEGLFRGHSQQKKRR